MKSARGCRCLPELEARSVHRILKQTSTRGRFSILGVLFIDTFSAVKFGASILSPPRDSHHFRVAGWELAWDAKSHAVTRVI
jgi:hypothetical protein